MARRIAAAGSAYTYATEVLGPVWGYAVGWLLLLDYFFVPMVCCIFTSVSLASLAPGVPFWIWPCLIAAGSTLINALGISVTSRVNKVVMVVQLLTIGAILVVCARAVLERAVPVSMSFPLLAQPPQWSAFIAGTAVAAYSFLGFDAVSTLAEETHEPRKSIPKAIVGATAVGAVIFGISAYALVAVHPALDFADPDTFAYQILERIAGPSFRIACTCVVVLAYFTAQISTHASVCRLLLALGRDNVLPRRLFAHISPRFATPLPNVLLVGATLLAGGLGLTIGTSTTFINFGAFTAFFFVNVCVVVSASRANRRGVLEWGAIGTAVVGAAVCLTMLLGLGRPAHLVGLLWSALGLVYLLYKTRLFTRPLPNMRVTIEQT
jgi:putrescine importer